jgi:hypothetical protein
MFIDYAILGVFSVAMFIYAYVRRPGPSSPHDDSDGGFPVEGGDAAPVDTPPSIHVPTVDHDPIDAQSPTQV